MVTSQPVPCRPRGARDPREGRAAERPGQGWVSSLLRERSRGRRAAEHLSVSVPSVPAPSAFFANVVHHAGAQPPGWGLWNAVPDLWSRLSRPLSLSALFRSLPSLRLRTFPGASGSCFHYKTEKLLLIVPCRFKASLHHRYS